jgi:hypothetical protein
MVRFALYGLGGLAIMAATSAQANCYGFQNNTDKPVDLEFSYNTPVGQGTVTGAAIQPQAKYPAKGLWCWNTPATYQATVKIAGGSGRPSWQGPLVLGNGDKAAPSGTYDLN